MYRPLWHQIRQERLTRYFPGDRSADFVGRIWAWRAEMLEHGAPAVSWEAALDGYAATLAGQHPPRPRTRGWRSGQPGRRDAAPAPAPTPFVETPEPASPEMGPSPSAHDTETH